MTCASSFAYYFRFKSRAPSSWIRHYGIKLEVHIFRLFIYSFTYSYTFFL